MVLKMDRYLTHYSLSSRIIQSNSGKTVIKSSKTKDGTVYYALLSRPFSFEKRCSMNIELLKHASIRIASHDAIIYFDPYQIEEETHDATYVFITHDHYDHYDVSSIKKVINENTILIIPTCLKDSASSITKKILIVEPNKNYTINSISFETIPAYNINTNFHEKGKGYVGYNVLLDGTYYYIMGDTDYTDEIAQVKTDICFVPIGGTYTMDVEKSAAYINYIKPKKTIPIHYGSIVGDKSLGLDFKKLIDKEIEVEILI